MKLLLFIAIVLSSFNAFSITKCGDDHLDRNFPSLNWEQVASYKVNSPYITLSAIVCLGVDYSNQKIVRFHYRDTSGTKRGYNISELKRKDTDVIKQSDFVSAARLVTRSVAPLTVKVISDKIIGNKRSYMLDFKFVRNMGRGFSRTDIRSFKVQGVLGSGARSNVEIYLNKDGQKTAFNSINLRVGGDLNIKTVNFSDNGRVVKSYASTDFSRASR